MTKVLVVEDTPMNMELVSDILSEEGYTVHEAIDGEEALKKIEEEVYNLILMDIELPGMNGIEVTRRIRARPAYKDVPVIALTAFAMKGDKERLLASGFNEYISKPINVAEFIKILNKYGK